MGAFAPDLLCPAPERAVVVVSYFLATFVALYHAPLRRF